MVPEEFQRYIKRNRRFALAGIVVLLVGAVVWFHDNGPAAWGLTMTGGDELGARHQLATILAHEVQPAGVTITVRPTQGSEEAMAMVDAGTLDMALVQGGLTVGPNVRQVAALYPEPLHLLVRADLAPLGIPGLVGKRVNLGSKGSGTRQLATTVLAFAGLTPGRDFVDESSGYEALRAMPPEDLPDALFAVLSIPADLATWFVRERGYHLIEIPFAEALAYRDFRISSARIPLMTYSVNPPVPDRDLQTVGNQLLLVANANVDPRAIDLVVQGVYDGGFARAANLPALNSSALDRLPELPLHEGTRTYRSRKDPLLTTEAIDNIESMRSFAVSMAIALFLFWRWYSRRRAIGFEKYISEVTAIEREALKLEAALPINLAEAQRLRARLGELKTEAIERSALGELKSEELMHSFLTHVTDVRGYLNSIILYERERLDEIALHREERKRQ
jgi:TRAP transporter TAXI family solute receptor